MNIKSLALFGGIAVVCGAAVAYPVSVNMQQEKYDKMVQSVIKSAETSNKDVTVDYKDTEKTFNSRKGEFLVHADDKQFKFNISSDFGLFSSEAVLEPDFASDGFKAIFDLFQVKNKPEVKMQMKANAITTSGTAYSTPFEFVTTDGNTCKVGKVDLSYHIDTKLLNKKLNKLDKQELIINGLQGKYDTGYTSTLASMVCTDEKGKVVKDVRDVVVKVSPDKFSIALAKFSSNEYDVPISYTNLQTKLSSDYDGSFTFKFKTSADDIESDVPEFGKKAKHIKLIKPTIELKLSGVDQDTVLFLMDKSSLNKFKEDDVQLKIKTISAHVEDGSEFKIEGDAKLLLHSQGLFDYLRLVQELNIDANVDNSFASQVGMKNLLEMLAVQGFVKKEEKAYTSKITKQNNKIMINGKAL